MIKDAEIENLNQKLLLSKQHNSLLDNELKNKNEKMIKLQNELMMLKNICHGLKDKIDGLVTSCMENSTPTQSLAIDVLNPTNNSMSLKSQSYDEEYNNTLFRVMEESEKAFAQKKVMTNDNSNQIDKRTDSPTTPFQW